VAAVSSTGGENTLGFVRPLVRMGTATDRPTRFYSLTPVAHGLCMRYG
jgi:hypothetical protein